ncbi:PadR family transcriptional regulator [Leptospira sp. 96542]|nr:PadR family transcriptional regulator [Leptospira sp. 96542]
MKRENKTQFALLGILSQCEMNGYEIRKYIESTISFFWSESFGQIYPTLKKLESDGLIQEVEKTDGNDKKKKVYRITKLGLKELKNWMETSNIQHHKRDEVLFKVFFGRHMSPNRLDAQIKSELEKNKKDLAQLLILKKELLNEWANHPDERFWQLTLEYAEKQTKLNLDWLSKVSSAISD